MSKKHFNSGDFSKSMLHLDIIIENEYNEKAIMKKAHNYFVINFYNETVDTLAMLNKPISQETLYKYSLYNGIIFLLNGNISKGTEFLNQAILADPTQYYPYVYVSSIHAFNDSYDLFLETRNTGIELFENSEFLGDRKSLTMITYLDKFVRFELNHSEHPIYEHKNFDEFPEIINRMKTIRSHIQNS